MAVISSEYIKNKYKQIRSYDVHVREVNCNQMKQVSRETRGIKGTITGLYLPKFCYGNKKPMIRVKNSINNKLKLGVLYHEFAHHICYMNKCNCGTKGHTPLVEAHAILATLDILYKQGNIEALATNLISDFTVLTRTFNCFETNLSKIKSSFKENVMGNYSEGVFIALHNPLWEKCLNAVHKYRPDRIAHDMCYDLAKKMPCKLLGNSYPRLDKYFED